MQELIITSELVNYITYGSGESQIGVGVAAADVNMNKFLGSDASNTNKGT